MASKEVFVVDGGVHLFGSLEWRVLDATQNADSVLRTAALERGATHFVTAKSSTSEEIQIGKKLRQVNRVSGGFYSAATEEGPGKKAHSLAAAFALWTRDGHTKAALCTSLPKEKGAGYAVVVVLNGMPVFDKVVVIEEEATSLMSSYISEHPDMSVFADDMVKFPGAMMSDGDLLSTIAACCDKTTLIRPVPADVVKIGIALVILASLVLGYWYYTKQKAEAARKALLLKAAQDDPVPKYLNALAVNKGNLGVDRPSLISAFNAAKRLPLAVQGWKIKNISCDKVDGCAATYERGTGTYQDLTKSLPGLKLSQPGSLDLNSARMVWQQEMVSAPVGDELLLLDEFVQGMSGSKMQVWLLAGLALQFQPPLLWPQTPGVPPNFKHPKALAVGKFSVSRLSLPVVREVIESAPANVVWSGWKIEFGDAKQNVLDAAKVNLVGSYYVKN